MNQNQSEFANFCGSVFISQSVIIVPNNNNLINPNRVELINIRPKKFGRIKSGKLCIFWTPFCLLGIKNTMIRGKTSTLSYRFVFKMQLTVTIGRTTIQSSSHIIQFHTENPTKYWPRKLTLTTTGRLGVWRQCTIWALCVHFMSTICALQLSCLVRARCTPD